MPRYICRLEHAGQAWYLEWDITARAPYTLGMSLEAFCLYYRNRYGEELFAKLPGRLARCHLTGTSALEIPLADLLRDNQAGPGGRSLGAEEIIGHYCHPPRLYQGEDA